MEKSHDADFLRQVISLDSPVQQMQANGLGWSGLVWAGLGWSGLVEGILSFVSGLREKQFQTADFRTNQSGEFLVDSEDQNASS